MTLFRSLLKVLAEKGEEVKRATARRAKRLPTPFPPTYTVVLEAGPRKGELCALQWDDLNWQARALTITRQLAKRCRSRLWPHENRPTPDRAPSSKTMSLLKRLKAHQAQIKLEAVNACQDYSLIFAYGRPVWGSVLGQQ